MAEYGTGLDLVNVTFSGESDQVNVEAAVSLPGPGYAVTNSGNVMMLGGADTLESTIRLLQGNGSSGTYSTFLNNGSIDTGSGADTIVGKLRAVLGDGTNWTLAGLDNELSTSQILMSGGADHLRGVANVDAGTGFRGDVSGLVNNGSIDTGGGANQIHGVATLSAASLSPSTGRTSHEAGIFGLTATSFPNGTIVTQAGDDVISGSARADLGVTDYRILAFGISFQNIQTGAGDDQVSGVAHVDVAGGQNSVRAVGFDVAQLNMGTGDDSVLGSASFAGGDSTSGSSSGASGSTIDTGAGNDSIVLNARAHGNNVSASGGTGTTAILGNGDDVLQAKAVASGTGLNNLGTAFGFAGGEIDTGAGQYQVVADAKADGHNAFAVGLETTVKLGSGAATIDARAHALAVDQGQAYGIFLSNLMPGNGEASIFAKGIATGANSTGYGIAYSNIVLGTGNDHLVARGSSAGIFQTTISGGAGNDTFDIGSGTGTIDGGTGNDLLILSGKKSDYTFTPTDQGHGVNIASHDGVTNLNVTNVEHYQFGGHSFTYDMIFV